MFNFLKNDNTDIEDVKKAIEFLANNHSKSLTLPKIQEAKNLIEKHRNDPRILEIIKYQYRPSDIFIATAGSYLWGCSQNYYGSVNKSCSALCFGSFPYTIQNSLNPTNSCQYSIWNYDKTLKKESNVSSSKAYIYVPEDWNSFTNEEISELKASGVFFASVLNTEFSKHNVLIAMTSIDNLPISKEFRESSKTNTSNYFWYFVAVFSIVVVFQIYLTYNF